jgi:hypothetical protein
LDAAAGFDESHPRMMAAASFASLPTDFIPVALALLVALCLVPDLTR